MAILDNIVSSWKLDEASGSAADSAGTNTLSNVGTATYSAGKINNAVNFNGSSQKLSIADASQTGLDLAGDYTFAFWVNFAATPTSGNQMELISKFGLDSADRSYILQMLNVGGTLKLSQTNQAGATETTTSIDWSPSTGTWYFVALTYNDSANEIKFYIDGSQSGTTKTSTTNPGNGAAAFQLGGFDISGVCDLNGSMDDVTVWARTLSSGEITTLYNGGTGVQYPFTTTNIKTINGLAKASVKTVNGLAVASVKSFNGLT